jgi:hypothetical protein
MWCEDVMNLVGPGGGYENFHDEIRYCTRTHAENDMDAWPLTRPRPQASELALQIT